jgi:hypothetical protein
MFRLNEAGYDENLDTSTITQLYKKYNWPTLLFGIENLNLNINQTDRITKFENALIKKSLQFAPFHHTDHLLDALKLNNMDEKLHVIRLSFFLRLLNNSFTRELIKELLKVCHVVQVQTSVLTHVLENMGLENPLNIDIWLLTE